MKKRRKTNAVKAQTNEGIQRFAERQVLRRHSDPCRDLHISLLREERPDAVDDFREAACAALKRALPIMNVTEAVQTDGHCESVMFKKVSVIRLQQGGVGGDGEADFDPVQSGEANRVLGRGSDHGAIKERLAPQEGQADVAACFCIPKEKIDGAQRHVRGHVFRGPAEAAFPRVAVGATEIALLRHGERERMDRWSGWRSIVNLGSRIDMQTLQFCPDSFVPRLGEVSLEIWMRSENLRAVYEKKE